MADAVTSTLETPLSGAGLVPLGEQEAQAASFLAALAAAGSPAAWVLVHARCPFWGSACVPLPWGTCRDVSSQKRYFAGELAIFGPEA